MSAPETPTTPAAGDWTCPTCGKRTYSFLHSCPMARAADRPPEEDVAAVPSPETAPADDAMVESSIHPTAPADGLLHHERKALRYAWHDGTCPEGRDCRSRFAHALAVTAWDAGGDAIREEVERIVAARVAAVRAEGEGRDAALERVRALHHRRTHRPTDFVRFGQTEFTDDARDELRHDLGQQIGDEVTRGVVERVLGEHQARWARPYVIHCECTWASNRDAETAYRAHVAEQVVRALGQDGAQVRDTTE